MKRIFTSFLFVGLILCSSSVFSQNDTAGNTIDTQLNACLDSSQNSSTIGMINCAVRAKDAWDKELNKYYNLLLATLSKDEKDKLRTAQRKWLLFRDSESTFSAIMYRNMQGTMWSIAKVNADVSVIKQRALELKTYYYDKTPR